MKKLLQHKQTFFYWTLALVLITLPLPKYSLNSQAIIACVISWLLVNSSKEKWENFKKNKREIFIVSALFWLAAFGLFYTDDFREGIENLQKRLPFLIFPLVFFTTIYAKGMANYFLKVFSYAVVISSILALTKAAYFKFNNLGDLFYFDQLTKLLDKHTTYFALFCVVALIYFGNELINKSKKVLLLLLSSSLLIAMLYMLSVRISIVSLLVVGFLFFLKYKNSINKLQKVLFLIAILLLSLFYVTPNFQKRINSTSPEGIEISDTGSRLVHWKAAANTALDQNWLIGAGTGDGHEQLFYAYLEYGFDTGFRYKYNAHNQFLETMLYYGLFGLFILLIFLTTFFLKSLRTKDIVGLSIITTLAIFMITESILERHSGIVLTAFLGSLFLSKWSNSENTHPKNYLIVGPYSAVGGVSIHCKRLAKLFEKNYTFSFIDESPRLKDSENEIYNIRSKNPFGYLKLFWKADIVHIHTGIWWLRCIHIFIAFCLQKRTLVTIHSLSNLSTNKSVFVTRYFLRLTDAVIYVSEAISTKLRFQKNSYIIPAFIPPAIDDEPELPKEVKQIIEKHKDKRLIVGNAFKLVLHNDEDLYGLDLLVDVAKQSKETEKPWHIIFVVASQNDKPNLYEKYQAIIAKKQLEPYITLIPYPLSFIRLMQESTIVVRPTNTDGDALTIREAIYLHRAIIASDVTPRPKETILFSNRNAEDLFLKIESTLNGSQENNRNLLSNDLQSYSDRYQNMLKSI